MVAGGRVAGIRVERDGVAYCTAHATHGEIAGSL